MDHHLLLPQPTFMIDRDPKCLLHIMVDNFTQSTDYAILMKNNLTLKERWVVNFSERQKPARSVCHTDQHGRIFNITKVCREKTYSSAGVTSVKVSLAVLYFSCRKWEACFLKWSRNMVPPMNSLNSCNHEPYRLKIQGCPVESNLLVPIIQSTRL